MFWRGLGGYLPVQAFQAIIGLATVALFTRVLTPEQYGQYALAFPIAAIFQTVFLSWTEAAVERFHLTESGGADAANHYATVQRAWALCATTAVVLVAASVALLPLDWALELALVASIAATVAGSGLKIVQKQRRAEGRVGAYALTDIGSTGVGFALGWLCAVAGWGAAAPYVGAFGAIAACLLLSGPGQLRRARGGVFQAARAKRYAAYGLPFALSLIFSVLLTNADRLLIGALLDEASVGVYHAGYGVARRTLDTMFVWLGLAGGPALIAAFDLKERGELDRVMRTQASVMLLIGVPAAVGLALLAQPLTALLIGQDLREGAARVLPWIAASALVAGITTYHLNQAFVLARRPKLLILSQVPPSIASVSLNLLLIPRFGLDGAMWATVASFAVGAVTAYLLGRRLVPLPLGLAAASRAVVGAAVMAMVLSLLPSLENALLEIAVKALVGALVYGVALLAFELALPSPALSDARARIVGLASRKAGASG